MRRVVKISYFFDTEDKKVFQKILIDCDMTTKDFCKKYQISLSYISMIMNGNRACPDFIRAILRVGRC